jgi:hypothetical protein
VVEARRRRGYDVWWSDTGAIEKQVPARKLIAAPRRRKGVREDIQATYRSHQRRPQRHNPRSENVTRTKLLTPKDYGPSPGMQEGARAAAERLELKKSGGKWDLIADGEFEGSAKTKGALVPKYNRMFRKFLGEELERRRTPRQALVHRISNVMDTDTVHELTDELGEAIAGQFATLVEKRLDIDIDWLAENQIGATLAEQLRVALWDGSDNLATGLAAMFERIKKDDGPENVLDLLDTLSSRQGKKPKKKKKASKKRGKKKPTKRKR